MIIHMDRVVLVLFLCFGLPVILLVVGGVFFAACDWWADVRMNVRMKDPLGFRSAFKMFRDDLFGPTRKVICETFGHRWFHGRVYRSHFPGAPVLPCGYLFCKRCGVPHPRETRDDTHLVVAAHKASREVLTRGAA